MSVTVQSFAKIFQTVLQIWYQDFSIFKMAAVHHSGFSKFIIFSSRLGWKVNCTKFGQNWSNGCGHIAFNTFQTGGHPPSCISKNLDSYKPLSSDGLLATMHHHAKFHRNQPELL